MVENSPLPVRDALVGLLLDVMILIGQRELSVDPGFGAVDRFSPIGFGGG